MIICKKKNKTKKQQFKKINSCRLKVLKTCYVRYIKFFIRVSELEKNTRAACVLIEFVKSTKYNFCIKSCYKFPRSPVDVIIQTNMLIIIIFTMFSLL